MGIEAATQAGVVRAVAQRQPGPLELATPIANMAGVVNHTKETSGRKPMHVGIYSMAPLPYPNAPSDTGLDDLFGR